jgi:vacuolar-type H+-ATPase subunit E/Vma4
MEELQSTDILDREILEDARKKVLRILKTADETIHNQNSEWEKKTTESINDLERKYKENCGLISCEIMARLPIDKRRAKAEKIENIMTAAVDSWYCNLSHETILDYLTKELKKRLSQCADILHKDKKRALIHGIEQEDAEIILNAVNENCSITKNPSYGYPSITLESGNIRVTASIQKTVDFLLHERRIELIEALLGSSFLEEGI